MRKWSQLLGEMAFQRRKMAEASLSLYLSLIEDLSSSLSRPADSSAAAFGTISERVGSECHFGLLLLFRSLQCNFPTFTTSN